MANRLSKRDARRFAVGPVRFSRRGLHRRCQNSWSQAVADFSLRERSVAPPRFEARNIARVLDIADDIDEIISIDGNSTDATLITARSNRPDVRGSAPGRRRQSLLAYEPGEKTAVAGIQRCLDGQLDSIRSNRSYSDTGRKTEMAKAVLAAQRRLKLAERVRRRTGDAPQESRAHRVRQKSSANQSSGRARPGAEDLTAEDECGQAEGNSAVRHFSSPSRPH